MASNGFLRVRVYTSEAQLPVEDATVTVTQSAERGSDLIATRITDESGLIELLTLPTPDRTESLQAGTPVPYAFVDIVVDHPEYERVLVENAQIFAGIITEQNVALLPIEERPAVWNLTEIFRITPQPL
ncbi:MAG: spore cortex-lytic protein [Oscillospiraceae bacterium]|nr:spore cortex-lytic protein [Oscillospiraceae bacterium]